jgi:hypothetical protein
MKNISLWWRVIISRWKATTPLFFKWIVRLGLAVSGTAVAIHVALVSGGAVEPAWWTDIYPYLIGVPAGMAAVAKMTKVTTDEKEVNNGTGK